MTEAEFLAMDARERDALVAAKVMGLKLRLPEGFVCITCGWNPCTCYGEYTTDISDAWEVVEKLDAEWQW